MAITYNDLNLELRRAFLKAGIPGATLEARELCCFGSGKSREEFQCDGRMYMADETEQAIRALAARHLAGEPVAYLIGEWDFYGLTFDVTPDVLIPRQDTEVLVEQALKRLEGSEKPHVLDLCTGSGCIGIALAAHLPEAKFVLADFSEAALRVCRQNIRRHDLRERCTAVSCDARIAPGRTYGEFDCIVCNPPYIPKGDIASLDASVRDYEPRLALDGGPDGFEFYHSVTGGWTAALKTGGCLLFEVGIGQADSVARLMLHAGYGDIEITPDTAGIPRVVAGVKRDSVYDS